jgi:hypothetical protein
MAQPALKIKTTINQHDKDFMVNALEGFGKNMMRQESKMKIPAHRSTLSRRAGF